MDEAQAAALDTAWRLLTQGAADRRSPLHTPAVATITQGQPDQRIMVLRAADRATATLRFHTDARAPKLAALAADPGLHVLAYHPGEAIQLRLSGQAQLLEAASAEAIWAAATPFARRIYMVEGAPGRRLSEPGSGLPAWVEGRKPTEAELAPARANFAVLTVAIRVIDWLHLAQDGHRRVRFDRAGGGWRAQWIAP